MTQGRTQSAQAGAESGQLLYFNSFLAPLQPFLLRGDVTDLFVNRPGEVWVETLASGIERHDVPDLSERLLLRLASQVAAYNNQGVSREHPLLSASLPDGARVQIILPPATRKFPAMAIRKHIAPDLQLSDYTSSGAFDGTLTGNAAHGKSAKDKVARLLSKGAIAEALALAVKARLTILVSGGTSTGKTTFLNSMIREIDAGERLIYIEDTPELKLRHDNAIGLLAARGDLGEADVTANDLVAASLRMRPDRIILGELRGVEAFAFLRAVNTGHPGSMTTVHANSPEHAVEQVALLVMQGGTAMGGEDIRRYIRSVVDLYVQLDRVGGRRMVSEVRMGE